MPDGISHDRRRFLGTAAAAPGGGVRVVRFVEAQSGKAESAAWKQPQLFCEALRVSFRPLLQS